MRKILFSSTILVVVWLFFGCQRAVIDNVWIYVEGGYAGDVLDFRNGYYKLDKENNIIRVDSDSLVGVLKKHNWNEIIIQSSSGKEGTYKQMKLVN